MATSVQNVPFHNTTDADFRVWGKAISDAIAAVGLVKVADTGTVNWATVTKGTLATNTAWAWEIWRLNDALQTTAPLFIKIEYGTALQASAYTNPGMWVTLGRGSDGAGAITGVLAPRRAASNAAVAAGAAPTSSEPIYVSSDGSSLCLSARIGATFSADAHAPAFVIDRSRDGSGQATAAGGVILTEGAGSITYAPNQSTVIMAQMHAWTYAGDSTMGDVPAVVPSTVNGVALNALTTLANGDQGLVFPYVVTVPGHPTSSRSPDTPPGRSSQRVRSSQQTPRTDRSPRTSWAGCATTGRSPSAPRTTGG